MSIDWRVRYKDKLLTAEQAAGLVKSGQRVLTSVATTEPRYLIAALCARWRCAAAQSSKAAQSRSWKSRRNAPR